MKKRIISMLLIISILLPMFPMDVFAVSKQGQKDVEIQKTQVNPFKDIGEDEWYYDAVMYALENNIFAGTGSDTFSPQGEMTRSMYITVMGRVAEINPDDYPGNGGFVDVDENAYYAPYVVWAAEKGITNGVSKTSFSPSTVVTRQQMAVLTVNYFDAYEISYPESTITTQPADLDGIASWAQGAVMKLWSCGMLEGDEKGNVQPTKSATRVEAATFSMRTHETVEKWQVETGIKPPKKDKEEKPEENKKPEEDKKPDPDPDPDPDPPYTSYYNITFNSNGGSDLGIRRIQSGSSIGDLPTPIKDGQVFIGWYYDAKFQHKVKITDKVTSNIEIYARYLQTEVLDEVETPSFGSALDQGTDFAIGLVTTKSMTSNEVKNLLKYENLSDPDDKNFIKVEGSGTQFSIKGDKFTEGSTYKVILDSSDISFVGLEKEVKQFNFTIAKEEVLKLSIMDGLTYIKFSDITNMTQDGKLVKSINTPLVRLDKNNDTTLSNVTSGTFDFTGNIEVGSTVTIYTGIIPSDRKINDTREGSDGEIAYVEITAKNDKTYKYKSADIENVLFRPDVLPIDIALDKDGERNNNSVTVDEVVLEFFDDKYLDLNLDSQTTIDVGDYIAFFKGDSFETGELEEYGLINNVYNTNGEYILGYEIVTLEEMLTAMDMYNTEAVDGDKLLEDVDVAMLEKNIENQARASGFAEEAAMYLSEMALKTNSFTELRDDLILKDLQIQHGDEDYSMDDIRLMASNSKVEYEISKLKAKVSTKLEHFDVSGIRLTLEVGVDITIKVGDEKVIVITVTGEFEQEVHVKINVSGGAQWKFKWIIPYIADYQATTSIDLYNFTGIGINATIVTKEKEDNIWTEDKKAQKITDELKKMLEAKDKILEGIEGWGDDLDIAASLSAKYGDMLDNESDWISIIDKALLDKDMSVDPFNILVVKIGINFVVSVDMNVSLGCTFYYENAKRYVYNVKLYEKSVTNDVIDIKEERYEFAFYAMGTMGIRAGIKVEIAIGLFSTKLGSVGVTAEAGVYVKIYGYFYYKIEYSASKGRSTYYAGELFLELGIYLEVNFLAQALAGTFKHEIELYSQTIPLLTAGRLESILDFNYTEEEALDRMLEFTKDIKDIDFPREAFDLKYMNMTSGEEESKAFNMYWDFEIEFTNEIFTHKKWSNKVTVTPPEGSKYEEGEMIVTLKNNRAFTSEPLKRVFKLVYNTSLMKYRITFDNDGAGWIPSQLLSPGQGIKIPADPKTPGYDFVTWSSEFRKDNGYVIPEKMGERNIYLYAIYKPRTDTKYQVKHYQERANSSSHNKYILVTRDTETFTGTTASKVSPEAKTYEGFITPSKKELVINQYGDSVLSYYYDRETYDLSYDYDEARDFQKPSKTKLKYGDTFSIPKLEAKGYVFKHFEGFEDLPEEALKQYSMPSENLTLKALWDYADDVKYRIEHYIVNKVGITHATYDIENKIGTTKDLLDVPALAGAKTVAGMSYAAYSVNGIAGRDYGEVRVKADDSLVVKIYYTGEEKKVKFNVSNEKGLGKVEVEDFNSEENYLFYEKIRKPFGTPKRLGYHFSGWKTDEELRTDFVFGENMLAEDINVYGKMIPNTNTKFTIERYFQNIHDDNYTLNTELSDNLSGTSDSAIEFDKYKFGIYSNKFGYEGFSFKEFKEYNSVATGETIIKADGTTVIQVYYTRNYYPLTLRLTRGNDTVEEVIQLKYGKLHFLPSFSIHNETLKNGYTWSGWKAPGTAKEDPPVTQIIMWANNNFVFEGSIQPQTNRNYGIEYYIQNIDNDDYTLKESWSYNIGSTDEVINISDLVKEFEGITFEHGKVNDEIVLSTKIVWDNSLVIKMYYTRNEYTVNYVVENGENSSKVYKFQEKVDLSKVVTAPGYSFDGWYKAADYKDSLLLSAGMTSENVTAYGRITADDFTKYTVEYYKQDTDCINYTLDRSNPHHYGITGQLTAAEPYEYEGFKAKEFNQVIIKGDGSTVIKIYYDREQYDITYDTVGGTINSGEVLKHIYGTTTTLPTDVTKEGYRFDYWTYLFEGKYEPATAIYTYNMEDRHFVAQWRLASDIEYTVKHLVEELDGSYVLAEDLREFYIKGVGTTGELTNALAYSFNGFTVVNPIVQQVIKADGTTVVEIKYTRNIHKLSWKVDGLEVKGNHTKGNVKYDAPITKPEDPVKEGHYFMDWNYRPSHSELEYLYPETMPDEDVEVYAKFGENEKLPDYYHVEHYMQNPNEGEDEPIHLESEMIQGNIDDGVSATAKEFDYCDFDVADQRNILSGKILADGKLELKLYYTARSFKLSYEVDGVKFVEPVMYKYQERITHPVEVPTKEGFRFHQWNVVGATPETGLFQRMLGEDTILVPVWIDEYVPQTFTVTFMVDDKPYGKILEYGPGQAIVYPEVIPTKTGHLFTHWQQDGEYFMGMITGSNVILTPHWAVNDGRKFTATLEVEGVQNGGPVEYKVGDKIILPALTPPAGKEGWELKVWIIDELGYPINFQGYMIERNITLMLMWMDPNESGGPGQGGGGIGSLRVNNYLAMGMTLEKC